MKARQIYIPFSPSVYQFTNTVYDISNEHYIMYVANLAKSYKTGSRFKYIVSCGNEDLSPIWVVKECFNTSLSN